MRWRIATLLAKVLVRRYFDDRDVFQTVGSAT
jgi:hypothetical protein